MALSLPTSLDTPAATPLAQSLRDTIAMGGAISLDGAEVVRVGQACLQVLLSARQAAIGAGLSFTIERPSDELRAAGSLAGLDTLFAPAA